MPRLLESCVNPGFIQGESLTCQHVRAYCAPNSRYNELRQTCSDNKSTPELQGGMRGARTPFSSVGEGGRLSEYRLKNKGTKPSLTLVTVHGLKPREPKRRPVWLVGRTHDDSGKRQEFWTSGQVCNSGGEGSGEERGRKTTGSNLFVRGCVPTYRKQTWVATGRQVEDYHFSMQMMAAWAE